MKITVKVSDIKITIDENIVSGNALIKYKDQNEEVLRALESAVNGCLKLLKESKS